MPDYLIEFGNNVLRKTFSTDSAVIDFCEEIINEYEFGCPIYVMKEIVYEDHLAHNRYWQIIWNSIHTPT